MATYSLLLALCNVNEELLLSIMVLVLLEVVPVFEIQVPEVSNIGRPMS